MKDLPSAQGLKTAKMVQKVPSFILTFSWFQVTAERVSSALSDFRNFFIPQKGTLWFLGIFSWEIGFLCSKATRNIAF